MKVDPDQVQVIKTEQRPNFATPEDWLEHYEGSTAQGARPWEPATRGELLLADQVGLLDLNPQWIPGRMGLSLLGLPTHFGRTLEPFSERFRERFLTTLMEDPEFLSALANCLNGVVA